MLEIQAIRVGFHGAQILHDISLRLEQGTVGCLLGPSGGGKTTILRAVAGFAPLLGGAVSIGGRRVSGGTVFLPPEDRRVGMVFQDLALFPHLSVAENIAFGLWRQTVQARRQRVEALLALIGLEPHRHRYPHQLSGGQRQRVALARAMAPQPDLLLLDEPFSSLDQALRERLAREVREILHEENMTALLVTHDQHEAFAMADSIGVIHEGRLRQWGTIADLYHRPACPFVARFIGEGALLPGVVAPEAIDTVLGRLPVPPLAGLTVGSAVDVLVRPEHVIPDPTSRTVAVVERCAFRGSRSLCSLRLEGGRLLEALVDSDAAPVPGARLAIRLHIRKPSVFAVDE